MLLESTLIIYAARPEQEAIRRFVARKAPYVSVVSKVETLGHHELGENERRFLEAFFDAADMLPVSQSTVAAAIRLRSRRRMSLGDALIAGTALSHGLPLATHNTSDVAWVYLPPIARPVSAGSAFAA